MGGVESSEATEDVEELSLANLSGYRVMRVSFCLRFCSQTVALVTMANYGGGFLVEKVRRLFSEWCGFGIGVRCFREALQRELD